ncbi:hypothetical protein [Chitinophaga skermanii]|nr:hypothetical protein [Chitinophaga skermanii]
MADYDMLYEEIVLSAWGKTDRNQDPFRLGDKNTLKMAYNDLRGDNGHDIRFSLACALRKVAADQAENKPVSKTLLDLDRKAWKAKSYNDITIILEDADKIFKQIGIKE